MRTRSNRWILVTFVLLVLPALALCGRIVAAQSAGTGGYRLLQDAIDVHLHIDPDTETSSVDAMDIARMKFARQQGMRGFVIKNHHETTASVAYLIRKEIPGVEAFGSVVLNFKQGGL